MTGARELTAALGGRWHGRNGSAPCPVCQPERRRDQLALSIGAGAGGRLLLWCFKAGCSYADIAAAAGLCAGSWRQPDPAEAAARERALMAVASKRAAQAESLWQEALPIEGTLASRYLRRRGITCDLPTTLRFHPEAWHGATATRRPAMVALVEGGGSFAAHRTYLRPDGSGKAAIDPAKAMLGSVAGGAVRVADGPGLLVVAEGIETALSLACGFLDEPATIRAALSTSGMIGLRLPSTPARLIIAVDGDKAGRGAALTFADRAARSGWEVSILDPGDGLDFNDLLLGKAVAA